MVLNRSTRLTLAAALVVIVIGGAAVLLAFSSRGNATLSATPSSPGLAAVEGTPFTGVTEVTPPRPLKDFTLTNQDGQPVQFSNFHGKFTLLFFGYTHCPDVCPLTLLEYKQIKNALGERADEVNRVFISVDGERDTPDTLKTFIARFDSGIVGLTGDEATLLQIGTDYDLYFAKRASPTNQADDYIVDHTSNLFVVNPQGELVAFYTFGTDIKLVTADLQQRLG
jgi:protein SCO1/2